jgi:hypothetical protein
LLVVVVQVLLLWWLLLPVQGVEVGVLLMELLM